jgi:hypothetical protein
MANAQGRFASGKKWHNGQIGNGVVHSSADIDTIAVSLKSLKLHSKEERLAKSATL